MNKNPDPSPAGDGAAELQDRERQLLERLLQRPALFDFTRAIAILQAASPASVVLGELGPPEREAVRLRPALELGFPTADIHAVEALPAGGPRWRLESTFMGLYGQASPLPAYLTEALLSSEDPGPQRDFLDIIQHRLLSLAWRGMTQYRLLEGASHEPRLLALIGRAEALAPAEAPATPAGQEPGTALPPRLLLARAGLMSQQPRSAAGLERVLAFWLEAPVEVEQCLATWIDLPPERRIRLGQANARLGVDTIAGSSLRDRTTTFLVRIGPLGTRSFRRLLPDGDQRVMLEQLVSEFNPGLLDYRIELLVAPPSLPEVRLGGSARLGWDTCLPGPGTEPIPIRFPSALAG